MMDSVFASLEGMALSVALRQSTWTYPFVNAGHILGVALLAGAILPLDLRLLGAWRHYPVPPFLHALWLVAATGLGLVVTCGLFLFIARATEYAASPLFQIKMVVVLLPLSRLYPG